MKMIGIKLADGSFYPLLEEGVPAKKTLDLTTARDNQTSIMVDLYRSETDSMEDAEYAATLRIDNLVAHPNGEPDISFTVALDEQNKLFAEIDDGESGGHNTVTVSLVEGTAQEHPNGDGYGPAITAGAALAAGGLMRAAAAQQDASIEPPDFSDLDLPEELDLTKPVPNPLRTLPMRPILRRQTIYLRRRTFIRRKRLMKKNPTRNFLMMGRVMRTRLTMFTLMISIFRPSTLRHKTSIRLTI